MRISDWSSGVCSSDLKERFISERLHWPITNLCSDITWRAATEDKWLSYKLLQHLGVATPQTLAVIDRSGRSFGPDRRLASAQELRDFLAGAAFPIFAKPNGSLGSFGAFVIEGYESRSEEHTSELQSLMR